MRLDGAVMHLDGVDGARPIRRTVAGWVATFNVNAGSYQSGHIVLPDASTIPFVLDHLIVMPGGGMIKVYISDTDTAGAELTRRMMALAA